MGVRNVLITGVTGFLGRGLVAALHEKEGIALFGHSREAGKATAVFKNFRIQLIEGINSGLLDHFEIHTVIHLAGIAHDLNNKYAADDYFIVNDKGTRCLYDEFLRSRGTSFVFLSSIKAAVDTASSPVAEDIVPKPISPYGQSKLNAEHYIQQNAVAGKRFYVLRPCMVHGPGNKGNLNLLYKYVRTGLPFPLGAFNNQRSFLSAENLNFIMLNLIRENIPSGIYHLADDGSLSTADLFTLIATTTGKSSPVLKIPQNLVKGLFRVLSKQRMLDKLTEDMLVSNQKIKRQLSAPMPVTLEQGIMKTIRSFDGRR